MNRYENYPINIIPERIITAQKSFIPMPPKPIKPLPPKVLKVRYIAMIICITTVVLAISYKFMPIESMWINVSLAVLFSVSSVATVFEILKNKFKIAANEKENTKYELLMQRYIKECSEQVEVESQNNNPITLTEFRRKKVIENLLITNTALVPAHNSETKYFNYFYEILNSYFPDSVLINYTLEQNNECNSFIPNYIVAKSDYKLYIDVEIDVPYLLDSRHPYSYVNKNSSEETYTQKNHDKFFTQAGWIVIHFAEEQIIKTPESCCKHIAQIIFNITDDNKPLQKFNTVKNLTEIPMWNYSRAVELANSNYRESYLSEKPKEKNETEFLIELSRKSFEKNIVDVETSENEIVVEEKPISSEKISTVKIKKAHKAKQKLQAVDSFNNLDEDDVEVMEMPTEPLPKKENNSDKKENFDLKKSPITNINLIIEGQNNITKIEELDPEIIKKQELKRLIDEMEQQYENSNWKNLVEACNKVLEKDNTNETAYLRRACANGNLGNYQNVISDCTKIIEINPKNATAYYNYGVVCLILKRPQDALENLKKAIENDIQNPQEIYRTIAEIYRSQADIENYKAYLRLATSEKESQKSTSNQNNTEKIKEAVKKIKISSNGTTEITFSSTDEYVLTCENSNGYSVFRTSDFKLIHSATDNITCAAFSRNTKFLALGGSRKLNVMNIIDGKITSYAAITNFTGEAKKMFFHPFNNEILFVSDNFALYKIDLRSRVINRIINDFRLYTVSPDLQYVAGKDFSNNIKVFRITVLAEILKLKIPVKSEISSMALSREASKLYYSDNEGRINIYNIRISADEKPISLPYEISEIKLNSENIAAICDDRKIRVFDLKTNQQTKEIDEKFLPQTICLSNNNKLLAVGNVNEDFNIYNL